MRKEYHMYDPNTKEYISTRVISEPEYQLSPNAGHTTVPVPLSIYTKEVIGVFDEEAQRWLTFPKPEEELMEQVEPE